MLPGARVDFHGREKELGFLVSELAHVSGGQARTVVVTGDAGSGKSRLLEEFARKLPGRVLRGTSHATLSADLPYAPLTQALRPLVRSGTFADLTDLERGGLAPVLPMLATQPAADAGHHDRWGQTRVFELLLSLLARLADETVVTLVVDDLQWADQGTLDLLLFLSENLTTERVLIAGTVRSDELVPDDGRRRALTHLAAHSQLVELAGLDRDDVAALLEQLLPQLTPTDLASVMVRSRGNPFFVLELAGALSAGRPQALPRRLADLLSLRLRALSPSARRVVALAACCGGPVHHTMLAATSELPPDQLETVLRECVDAYVLRPVRRSAYEFRHALLEEFAYADLLPGERANLHRRVAETLEADLRLAGDPAEAAVALARHWRGAGEPARALEPMLRAAVTSRQLRSFGDAARLLTQCRALWEQVEGLETVADLDHAGLLAALADSLRWDGQAEEAESVLRTAIDEVGATRDTERLAALHEQLARHLSDLSRGDEALRSARQACRLVAPGATALSARSYATLGAILVSRGDYGAARPELERALAQSTEGGHADERVYSLGILGAALANLGASDEAVVVLEESLAAATELGAAESIVRSCINLSYVLENAGRREEAVQVARLGADTARRSGMQHTVGGLVAGNTASPMLALGRLTEARDVLEQALGRPGPPGPRSYLMLVLAELEAVSGGLDAAEQLLARERTGHRQVDAINTAQAAIVGAQVELARHRPAHAHAVASSALTTLGSAAEPMSGLRLCATGMRALADLADLGRNADPASAGLDKDASLLLSRSTRLAAQLPDMPPAQELLQLCRLEDARRRGADHPGDWRALAETPGVRSQPLLEAYLLLRMVKAPRRAGTIDDRATALARASALATSAGALPLLGEIHRAAALAGIRLADPDGVAPALVNAELERLHLTAREREVLDLLGEGASNRQIARKLAITEKTASVHVSNVLRKLDVRTRTEASVLLHRLKAVEREKQ